jgi:hypothetical protein
MNTVKSGKMIALVYRAGKGCRQYHFASLDELKSWTMREPYKNEILRVLALSDDQRIIQDVICEAAEAVELVRLLRPWGYD